MTSLHSIAELKEAGLLPPGEDASVLDEVAARYAIAVTPEMTALAREHVAIAAQFVPSPEELNTTPNEQADPIGDSAHSPVKGIVHRYDDRVLLKLTHVCPVYCRFCFRREMVGPHGEGALSKRELDNAIAYVAATPTIVEVIVTGGDPFILSARRIADVTSRLAGIPHVRALRWHTRVPIVAPKAITNDFVSALTGSDKTVYVAIHANHPAELTATACQAIGKLADAGIVLLSQTVLLRDVNADADVLERLMCGFVENRIRPYYLHHGDLAPGTSHFRMTIDEGRALMSELRRRLTDITLPQYVIDIPGGFGKVPVAAARRGDHGWIIPDRFGREHLYSE